MHKSLIIAKTSIVLTAALFATSAQAFEFTSPVTIQATVTKNGAASNAKKDVKLMRIKLSSKEQMALMNYTPKKTHLLNASSSAGLPSSINLGMNDVPVLDQGMHGSCVTFALTAALDALIYKSDYISQLCYLSLGKTLEDDSYYPSGWWGTFGGIALDQISRFGVVDKKKESTEVCGGLKTYPSEDFLEEGTGITPKSYKEVSEDVSGKFNYVQLMNPMLRFESQFADKDQAANVLNQVKTALAKGNRLLVGVYLQMSPYCGAAACATRNKANDTWALTDQLDLPPTNFGGHEMVVYGYDDNAVAYDRKGTQHRGLLILRNSWGEDVGDNGNFYMSYDYFKKLIMEVHEIREPKDFVY